MDDIGIKSLIAKTVSEVNKSLNKDFSKKVSANISLSNSLFNKSDTSFKTKPSQISNKEVDSNSVSKKFSSTSSNIRVNLFIKY